jgi:pilus assembly protein CpaF
VLEVKGDFCRKVKDILTRHGRESDYVEVNLNADYRYNPLYNNLDAYALAYNIASLLSNLFGKGTIRKFNAKHFGIEDLIPIGTITQELAGILESAVVNRQNILISGGTGTGKTTLLNILAHFIPAYERILIIEDTAEIQIAAPNLVRFEARVAQNGIPAVTIRELLKASLRHRPDRILLGEIRGAEAFDLLQLLNTGHSGTISTVHANSALQSINRFTTCVLQSNVDLPYRAIKSNIADSLNLLVHVERRPGRRFVSEVLEISGYSPDADRYDLKRVFVRKEDL